jgi:MFS family permease
VQSSSLGNLALVVTLFFFTSNLSGSFLPIYFNDLGLSVAEIAEILLFTFILLGLLPIVLLKTVKDFERIITVGIFTTMLFFIILIYVKEPIVLGLAHGISNATFWPSFNLLQFRLSESGQRARTLSFFSSILPALAGIAGPAVGGYIIENFGYTILFAASIILYLASFLFSTRIRFKPEEHKFSIPRSRRFTFFFMTFIILGLIEAYWFPYPFLVHKLSGTVLNMGFVLAASAVLISAISFSVNWLSDIRRTRVEFAIVGAALNVIWYFAIATISSTGEIIALSLLSGLAGAFQISWFAHYGDSFGKEYYASILVMMETGLMIGRLINLMPTTIFVSDGNYAGYFTLSGTIALCLIPLYVLEKVDSAMKTKQNHCSVFGLTRLNDDMRVFVTFNR